MKLYRMRYKKSFVTRLRTDEVEWSPPTEADMPPTISVMPGVPVQHCEMIVAHWAERRVEVPAHDEDLITVHPAWDEKVPRTIPGYWKEARVLESAHYETQEIWVPEHKETQLIEIPGYFEERRVKGEGHYETQEIWIPGHYEQGTFWQEPRPARNLPGKWIEYPYWVEGEYRDHRVWIEGRWERKQFWVDATWEPHTVKVPGQFRDHRVWVEERWVRKQVWIESEVVFDTVTHLEETVTTIVAVPVRVERQSYWQEAYEKCWLMHPEDTVIAGVVVSPEHLAEMGEWFSWYQTTPAGQFFMQGAETYGWIEEWTHQQVIQKAWEAYRHFQPDVKVRIAPDIVVKMRPHELQAMLDSPQYAKYMRDRGVFEPSRRLLNRMLAEGRTELTSEESAWLLKAGLIAAMVAAAAIVVYHAWPGAKFEYKVTYTEWVYILRYQESFTYADLIAVSPEGKPTYLISEQTGGPIMREERSELRDMWYFGEPWMWSAYVEEGRWWGIGETRHWYEAEVEFLGYVKKSGAPYYTKHSKIDARSTGGHEPGWVKEFTEWGVWVEEEEHERI